MVAAAAALTKSQQERGNPTIPFFFFSSFSFFHEESHIVRCLPRPTRTHRDVGSFTPFGSLSPGQIYLRTRARGPSRRDLFRARAGLRGPRASGASREGNTAATAPNRPVPGAHGEPRHGRTTSPPHHHATHGCIACTREVVLERRAKKISLPPAPHVRAGRSQHRPRPAVCTACACNKQSARPPSRWFPRDVFGLLRVSFLPGGHRAPRAEIRPRSATPPDQHAANVGGDLLRERVRCCQLRKLFFIYIVIINRALQMAALFFNAKIHSIRPTLFFGLIFSGTKLLLTYLACMYQNYRSIQWRGHVGKLDQC